MPKSIFIFLAYFSLLSSLQGQTLKTYKQQVKLMGSRFEITAVSEDEERALKSIEAAIVEIKRIEALISSWDPDSETSEINRMAGIRPVPVSQELFALIYRSYKVSQLTDGAFDISFASIEWIWDFDGKEHSMPSQATIDSSIQFIGYQNIEFDITVSSIFLKEKGMRIGFGAIGKGYAANKAMEVMREMGIADGVVNASGDLLAWGNQADGKPWSIGIADPSDPKNPFAWLIIDDLAVVTSGNYEKYCVIEGERYAHIINPKTGYPVKGIKSVTVICPDAELADALATSVFVLGTEKGLALINQLTGVEGLIIDSEDEVHTSNKLELHYYTSGKSRKQVKKKRKKP